jgi:hypothetical protein
LYKILDKKERNYFLKRFVELNHKSNIKRANRIINNYTYYPEFITDFFNNMVVV